MAGTIDAGFETFLQSTHPLALKAPYFNATYTLTKQGTHITDITTPVALTTDQLIDGVLLRPALTADQTATMPTVANTVLGLQRRGITAAAGYVFPPIIINETAGNKTTTLTNGGDANWTFPANGVVASKNNAVIANVVLTSTTAGTVMGTLCA